jgi:DNA-binding response OmpR family regulator/Tfp pilus assembly protein PilF
MKNVLIVEDSANLLKSLKLILDKHQSKFNLLVATNGEEAIKTLAEMPISVLVTDLYMPKVDGLELLAYMSHNHPETPCILMTAFGSPEVMEILGNLGIFRFLEKPFASEDLIAAITDAIGQIDKGKSIERMSTTGFLGLLQEEQRSCTLEVINKNGLKSYLYLIDGRLYDARCGSFQGEEAAIQIIGWEKVSLNLTDLPNEDIEARIHLSLKALISKAGALKKGAQKEEAAKPNPTQFLFETIRRAESGDTRQAQLDLAKILKINPRNRKAWIWYARTADNLKTINIALKNAAKIAPDDPEIAEETRKLTSAVKAGCEESTPLKHCFFCWAPVVKERSICHYCNAHLDINEDFFHVQFFGAKKEPDLKIITQSFQRFIKATILDHNNTKAHFLLAMAHINLDQWEEALEELKKARQIDPADNPYQKQLEILSDFMNDLGTFFTENKERAEVPASPKLPENQDKFIMVVEDSSTTRTIIKRMLVTEGYNVIEAKDGIEAIAKFAEKTPDLILLDIIMPGLDGYQTLAILRKKHGLDNIPVIMLTAKDSLIDKFKGKMSGSTEYLTKPFQSLDLIRKIKQHITPNP